MNPYFDIKQFCNLFAGHLVESNWTTKYLNYIKAKKENPINPFINAINNEDVPIVSTAVKNVIDKYGQEQNMATNNSKCLESKRILRELMNYITQKTLIVISFKSGGYTHNTELTKEPFNEFNMKVILTKVDEDAEASTSGDNPDTTLNEQNNVFGVTLPDTPPVAPIQGKQDSDVETKEITKNSGDAGVTGAEKELATTDRVREILGDVSDLDSDGDSDANVSDKHKIITAKNKEALTLRDVMMLEGVEFDSIRRDLKHFREVATKFARYADYMEAQFLTHLDTNYKDVISGKSLGPYFPLNFDSLNKTIKGKRGRPSKSTNKKDSTDDSSKKRKHSDSK